MAGSVAVQQRIENERSLGASAGGRRRIGPIAWVEHARFARLVGLGIDMRGGGRRLRRGGRRQIQRPLASAASERKHGSAQKDDSPSLRCWAVVAIHVKIPNAAAPYKDCVTLARPAGKLNFPRESRLSPIFALFPAA